MVATAKRFATYADLQALPAEVVGEILGGELVTHPRPVPRHAFAASGLGIELGSLYQRGRGGPGGWVILDEPELHLNGHVVVPDLAGWRRERLPSMSDTAFIETPPDWICEVLSPATEKYDRGIKRRIYAEAGIPHLWLLNPASQVLEAFQLAGQSWLLTATILAGEEVRVAPFEAVGFPLSVLFPFDPPEAPVTGASSEPK